MLVPHRNRIRRDQFAVSPFCGGSDVEVHPLETTNLNHAHVRQAGACTPGASYWDIGIRGDTGPINHDNRDGLLIASTYSVMTDTTGYDATNMNQNPTVLSQYCNGSRTAPELASGGDQVPPGISDATVPNPIFRLQPAATVDEGNNWINISWGPLVLFGPVTADQLANYSIANGSPAIDTGPSAASGIAAPSNDFFGNPRPSGKGYDIGAVEIVEPTPVLTGITPNSGAQGTYVNVTLSGKNLQGGTLTISGSGVSASNVVRLPMEVSLQLR
jgi:hypothetical protein